MSETVVKVEGLGKRFFLGHERSGELRETLGRQLGQLFWRGGLEREGFWALRDLNFEIQRGDVVGIIGRNGAGKSTLLKILSRITDPTTGRFEINGRVSSLLEVGTGFHSELTGRENIFLNGTILGMRRAEIKRKFDEIVAFSGIESFLDTPVKHYSSGMRVRLAFSVAAHLEPEILIIDEVLAVGDAAFQKKCLGKMDEVSRKEGRTIFFVSHNMAAVEHLCTSAMLLTDGRITCRGDVEQVMKSYLAICEQPGHAAVVAKDGVSVKRFAFNEHISPMDAIDYEIIVSSDGINPLSELAILVYNDLHERVGIMDLRHNDLERISSFENEVTIKGRIESVPLTEGIYQLGLFVSSSLFRGDFLSLHRLTVNTRSSQYVPYSSRHRGHVEFKNDFTVR